jgi:hypothetical protein
MLRRSQPLSVNMRNRKKWPYMVHHNKLPWNTVEPGSELSHKILAPCLIKVLEAAARMRVNGLVLGHNSKLPSIPEDQWLYALPSSTFIVPYKKSLNQNLVNVSNNSAQQQQQVEIDNNNSSTRKSFEQYYQEATQRNELDDAIKNATALAPYGWFGKRVVDEMSLAHYGPLHASIAKVKEVAEFRSPDLRIVCNALRLSSINSKNLKIFPKSSFDEFGVGKCEELCVYHFYRPNRAPREMESAFKQFVNAPVERPDTLALDEIVAQGASWKPQLSRKTTTGNKVVVSPMPEGPIPTSPLYGLIEREAIKPGDTFGCRSRVWGHHW